MPKLITQYRVFFASPGGLERERLLFRRTLQSFTEIHGEPRNVLFQPVGWEETQGRTGRPQALINEELRECDYAVFALHDRLDSPTGGVYSSAIEEEWALAEDLFNSNRVRNIALFFKDIDLREKREDNRQLSSVLSFKRRIEQEKRFLYKQYSTADQFSDALEAYLAKWLRDHITTESSHSTASAVTCFISYSWQDEEFAARLYRDLESAGISSWLDARDIRTSRLLDEPKISLIDERVDKAIKTHDKVLLILSQASVENTQTEIVIRNSLRLEADRGQTVLLPIIVDDAIFNLPITDEISRLKERVVGDFRRWRDEILYRTAFSKLARSLAISASIESARRS